MFGILVKLRKAVEPISAPLRRRIWRISDALWPSVDLQFRRATLKGRVFDAEWYGKENPDIQDYSDLADHFFRHGVNEGRTARFFDSQWYVRSNPSIGRLHIDAWNHYRLYGRAEGRKARFIYLQAEAEEAGRRDYAGWVEAYGKIEPEDESDYALAISRFGLSVVVDVCLCVSSATSLSELERFLSGLAGQLYPNWKLVVGYDDRVRAEVLSAIKGFAESDPRCSFLHLPSGQSEGRNFNGLLSQCQNPLVCMLKATDVLDRAALFWVAYEYTKAPTSNLFYSDEDRLDGKGGRCRPEFKPDFNYELLLAYNFFGDFVVMPRTLIESLDGYDEALWADSSYDLIFRVYENMGSEGFVHIPRVLNHVAENGVSVAPEADIVERHLERLGKMARVTAVDEAAGYNRVRMELPDKLPAVTIVIPTRDRVELLKTCIDSIVSRTTYENYDILIVDNGSQEADTISYLNSIIGPKIGVIKNDMPFNFSALNNLAIAEAKGEYVCLMNNDIEILTEDWLEEMISFAAQQGVGCVGARLWYPDDTLQHAGVLVGFHGVAGHMHKHIKKGDAGFMSRAVLHQSLSAVTAAVMLVKKSIYWEVGGFDESFAVAFNDVDFCLKVRDAGYRNVYTPYAEMYHHESASRGAENSPAKKARETSEINLMKSRYGSSLLKDPAYNPNLSLIAEDLSFAFPPRVDTLRKILS